MFEHFKEQNFFSPKTLRVHHLKNARILPPRARIFPKENQAPWAGGVFDEHFQFVGGVSRFDWHLNKPPAWGDCAGTYPTLKKEWQTLKLDAIFGGIILGQFGHFLVESLARFWWIAQNPQDLRPIILLKGEGWWKNPQAGGGGGANLKSTQFVEDFLNLLNIDSSRLIWLDKPSIVEHLSMAEESVHSFTSFTKEHCALLDKIAQNAAKMHENAPKIPKIYLTYSKAAGNAQCLNENLFEEFFQSQGYTVIAPETLPIAQQIALMANAQEVATTLGTTAHLTMFCAPQTQLIALLRVLEANIPQLLIQQMRTLNWHWVNVSYNFLPTHPTFGVRNLHFSEDFKQLAHQLWGEQALNTIGHLSQREKTENYLNAWLELHAQPGNFKSYLNQTSAFDFLNQMSQTLNGKTLNHQDFIKPRLPFFKRIKRALLIQMRGQIKKMLRAILPFCVVFFLYDQIRQNKMLARICGIEFQKN